MALSRGKQRVLAAGTCLLATFADPVASEDGLPGSPAPREPGPGEQACRLGERVLAARAALADPGAPGALDAIVDLGSDSRYYVMVRGWLVMQLQGDLSIVEASGGDAPPEVVHRVEFLEGAIRAIDLE
jgi:hypothetical protein